MDVFTRNGRRLESNPDLSIKVIKKANREKAPVARARVQRADVCITHIYVRLREQKPGEQIACTDPIKVLLSLARS